MTVSENLEYHGRIYSMKKKERNKRIEELLKLTDLESKRDTLGKDLSGGMTVTNIVLVARVDKQLVKWKYSRFNRVSPIVFHPADFSINTVTIKLVE